MIIFLPIVFSMIGILVCCIPLMLDIQTIWQLQTSGALMMLPIFGIILIFVGWFIMYSRAKKVGADILIAPARPDKMIWFYIFKDGTTKIVSAIREVEGFLYSKKLDTEAQDLKSYRLFDHSVRFVPEGLGHCVDLGKVLYTYVLKNKWGIKSIKEARDYHGTKENVIDGAELDEGIKD